VIEWDRWLLCFLIGILVGLIAALLKQSTSALGSIRLDDLKKYARLGYPPFTHADDIVLFANRRVI
jgi:hypothetical protein